MTAANSHRPSDRRAARVTDGGKGNSRDRARRRVWLVSTFGSARLGVVQCAMCSTLLTVETVTADRYPIPGWKGGTYRRGNIRPACLNCNVSDGGRMGRARQLAPNQRACCYCGFVSTASRFIQMIDKRWRCKSGTACSQRVRRLT